MDDADISSEREELARQAAAALRKPEPEYDGYCLNCGERCEGAYCDLECRDDSERFDRARLRNGL